MGMVWGTTALPGLTTILLTKLSMKALRSVSSLSLRNRSRFEAPFTLGQRALVRIHDRAFTG